MLNEMKTLSQKVAELDDQLWLSKEDFHSSQVESDNRENISTNVACNSVNNNLEASQG